MRKAAAVLVIFLFSCVAFAQSTFRGGLSGVVADIQGGVIPGVNIEATNNATGLVYKTVTTNAGDYSLTDLPLRRLHSYSRVQRIRNQGRAGTHIGGPDLQPSDHAKVAATATTVEVDADAI